VISPLRRVIASPKARAAFPNLAPLALYGDAGGIADLKKAPIENRHPNVNAFTYIARLSEHSKRFLPDLAPPLAGPFFLEHHAPEPGVGTTQLGACYLIIAQLGRNGAALPRARLS
jgi:hypothetical protein